MTRVLKRGGITTITLNRPRQRNALNEAVIRRLAKATDEAANDPDCRCQPGEVKLQEFGQSDREMGV